jgi:hypothetical protein
MLERSAAKYLLLVTALSAGCAKEVPIVELKGECGTVFAGQICTWVRMKGDSLIDARATVPLTSIENAPKDAQMAWPPVAEAKLKLPEPSVAKAGLTQLTMYWEAGGHPPAPFMTPHFDFHFYTVPAGDEMKIDCKDLSKPSALPAAYALPDVALPPDMAKMLGVKALIGLCVPQMGMHSLPTADLERKDVFSGDMVVGYWQGNPIYLEPMLTRAMLLEKKSFDLPIPAVPGLKGNYPRAFHAEYDATSQSYRFIFSGFAAGA